MLIEPPTPSAESVASSQDSSVFERSVGGAGGDGGCGFCGRDGDVEMSDASSLLSFDDGGEEEHGEKKARFDMEHGGGGEMMDMEAEMDSEMDEGTPTMTARPVVALGAGQRAWAPWRDEGNNVGVC